MLIDLISLLEKLKIFFGTLNGDSLEDSLITFFSPIIFESPGIYFAILLIVGLTNFESIFFP